MQTKGTEMKVHAYINKRTLTAVFVQEPADKMVLPPDVEKLKENTQEMVIDLDEPTIGVNRDEAIAAIKAKGYYVNTAKMDVAELL
ncbi:MAG: hypothetical protein IJS32_00375 [Kiritimatiellae bacterium]|nr:hypothetical protein [Kiritimatiellia bacterium]